jgi:hypothetical protein
MPERCASIDGWAGATTLCSKASARSQESASIERAPAALSPETAELWALRAVAVSSLRYRSERAAPVGIGYNRLMIAPRADGFPALNVFGTFVKLGDSRSVGPC